MAIQVLIAPTEQQLASSTFRVLVAECEKKTCERYSSVLLDHAEKALAGLDAGEASALRFVGHVTSLQLQTDTPNAGLVPMLRMGASRSLDISDLEAAHLDAVALLMADTDPELRARMGDVRWSAAKDAKAAEVAVHAYLESAQRLAAEFWPESADRYSRARQLARQLRRRDLLDVVHAAFHAAIDGALALDLLHARLVEILLDDSDPTVARHLTAVDAAAVVAEQAGDSDTASRFLELAIRIESLAGKEDATVRLRERLANIWEESAERYASNAPPHNIMVTTCFQNAIGALEKVPGSDARRRALAAKLVSRQRMAMGEFKSYGQSHDIRHLVEYTESLVRGLSTSQALLSLAQQYKPQHPAQLRAKVQEDAREHPLSMLFSRVQLDARGYVTAQRGSVLGGSKKEGEAAALAEMCRQATILHSVLAQALVEPARSLICDEHLIHEWELEQLLRRSPFVPEGRASLFARGLWSGLHADYATATHFLIPQVEHALRVIAEAGGAHVVQMKRNGTQEDMTLNQVLGLPQIRAALGPAIAFDLRVLLVEHFGSNLRNRAAHGLVDSAHFFAADTVYFWWVTLSLCLIPFVVEDSVPSAP